MYYLIMHYGDIHELERKLGYTPTPTLIKVGVGVYFFYEFI